MNEAEKTGTRTLSFAALEEQHFLAGEWEALADLYVRRLEAPALRGRKGERVRLLFRLGQVLEERCGRPDQALARFDEAVRLDPNFLPALHQLRRLHAARGQWELVLQIAEHESSLPMRPYERVAFHAELGEVWAERMGDAAQALPHFEQALELAPEHETAQVGRAAALAALGRGEEATRAYLVALERLRGPDRAPLWVALARLYQDVLGESERAFEAYRRALTDDPRHREALEALVAIAREREQWPIATELQERRFELADGDDERLAVALDAGALELERLRNPHGARLWYRRAREIAPERVEVELALAEVERLAGHTDARLEHLERALALDPDALPGEALLDAARAASLRGDLEEAARRAEQAAACAPEDDAILAALAEHLDLAGRGEELLGVLERRAALAGGETREQARLLLEVGRRHEEREDSEAALDAYRRAFVSCPAEAEAGAAVERLLGKQKCWQELRVHLEDARERVAEGQRLRVLCALGELLAERLEDPGAATQAFEQALALDPTSSRALRGLERVALAQGDDDARLRVLEREAEITTDPARLGELAGELVRLFEARDGVEEARLWAERWLEADPGSSAALETCARLQERMGDGPELTATLERLDAVYHGAERAENRRRLSRLLLERSEDDAVAWGFAALEIEPDHVPTLEALVEPLDRSGRVDELAEVIRRLAGRTEGARRAGWLDALARLRAEGLGDLEGALEALAALRGDPDAPQDVEARTEELLERLGRHEALAEHWSRRREHLGAGADAIALDLRRARLALERLHRPEEACRLFRSVLADDPGCEQADRGLEDALRATGDLEGLAALLAERARRTPDEARRERLELERAILLDEGLVSRAAARSTLAGLADGARCPEVRREAARRLESLLEREGDWEALRSRLEAELEGADAEARAALHQRLARLALDRMGERDAAIAHLEALTGLLPGSVEAWRQLARLYEEDGREADLLRAVEAELDLAPEPARELRLRGRAARLCLGEGDAGRAESHYRRILTLRPSHVESMEFLIERYETQEDHAGLAALLTLRLEHLEATGGAGEAAGVLALRLRIAALRAGPLDEPEAALVCLEPALDDPAALLLVAEPLAALYERTGRTEALVQLARRSVASIDLPGERAEWSLRLGRALEAAGREDEAAVAYDQVLADRPDDRTASEALCTLYRRSGQEAALARLLETRLARVAGAGEIPLRAELAELLSGPLGQPEAALLHERRILELDPGSAAALGRALALAEAVGAHEIHHALLQTAQRRARESGERAVLARRLGALLAGPLGRPEEALAAYRDALRLAPGCAEAREQLQELLLSLGRVEEALDLFHAAIQAAHPGDRAACLEAATALAERHLGAEAALPWLGRLAALRPGDAGVCRRIAHIHREAGNGPALLVALQSELRAGVAPDRAREVELERARLLEAATNRPAAAAALRAALEHAPHDVTALRELERLLAALNRPRERATVLETLVPLLPVQERNASRRVLAWLCAGPLSDPAAAARLLREALDRPHEGELPQAEALQSLGKALLAAGRLGDAAAVAEEELARLDPHAEVFRERRLELHETLARVYAEVLPDPERELVHLRARVDALASDPADRAWLQRAEAVLLARLRRDDAVVELAERLGRQLEREPDSAEGWLELARLREERLHRPGEAADAYERVLAREPDCLVAWRGLRRAAERLGDPETVVRTLEGELEHDPGLQGPARAALLRRLGEVAWQGLGATTRASRAFAEALEAEPGDLRSLRSLETLFEAMEDWRGAISLYESEIETLADADTARRQQVWLRIASLALHHTGERGRELRALEEAERLGPLSPEALRAFAEAAGAEGDVERFAERFARWCDEPDSGAGASDALRLAGVLEELGRAEAALVRTLHALELDEAATEGWERAARLRGVLGDPAGCADALERVAELVPGPVAVERLCAAAEAVIACDPERALDLVRAAVRRDPTRAEAHALRARQAEALGLAAEAAAAAAHALEVDGLPEAVAVETARIGARAARSQHDLDTATHLYLGLLERRPEDPEALGALGELWLELGDAEAACTCLEARLALGSDPEAARHLSLLGLALEARGRDDEALRRFDEALEVDARQLEAHAGRARRLEAAGRPAEASRSLRDLAGLVSGGSERAGLLMRASEQAVEAGEDVDAVAGLLREAVAADPTSTHAWTLLARRLAEAGRRDDVLETTRTALAAVDASAASAEIVSLRARALEASDDLPEAAPAYREAVRRDPARSEDGLACARLYRGLGEWREATSILREVADAALVEPVAAARVQHQLGRLLAGPLEDVAGAVEAYEHALALDPTLGEARRALADLLVHVPEQQSRALDLHREILAAQPARVASLRGLLRMARRRGGAIETGGLAILAGLGVATPEERMRVGATPAPLLDGLEDPLFECARHLARAAADEIGAALGVASPAFEPDAEASDPATRFRTRILACEAELAAPALVPLPSAEVGDVLRQVAGLCAEDESLQGDGHRVNALADALGRRARRRVRRALDLRSTDALAGIDFEAWRAELRALAAARALQATGADLRTALQALLSESRRRRQAPAAEGDLTALIDAHPTARALLRRVVLGWVATF